MLRQLLQKILPEQTKESLFRGAYSLMNVETRAKLRNRFQMVSMESTLASLQAGGFSPEGILDIGAHKGRWSEMAHSIFPKASIFMIEALPEHESRLADLQRTYSRINYTLATLAAESNKARTFYRTEGGHNDTSGSSLFEEQSDIPRSAMQVETVSLDELLAKETREGFKLIKIDVQGAEKEILEGGAKTMRHCEALIIELSLQRFNADAPLLEDILPILTELDLHLYDICTLMRSPNDDRLMQVDMLFLCGDSPHYHSSEMITFR